MLLFVGLVGLTLIFTRGSLFAPLQKRFAVLQCARCLGWWVGLGGSLWFEPGAWRTGQAFLVGGAVSLAATGADVMIAWIDSQTD